MISLDLRDVVCFLGAVSLLVGSFLLSLPAGLICLGVVLILASIFFEAHKGGENGTDSQSKKEMD